ALLRGRAPPYLLSRFRGPAQSSCRIIVGYQLLTGFRLADCRGDQWHGNASARALATKLVAGRSRFSGCDARTCFTGSSSCAVLLILKGAGTHAANPPTVFRSSMTSAMPSIYPSHNPTWY